MTPTNLPALREADGRKAIPMTRRGAVLSLLLAPFGQYPKLSLMEPVSKSLLTFWFPKKPTDKMLSVTWSDGTALTLTEAEVRTALEASHD